MERYSVIEEKQKREIVLLRGSGCVYRRCRFCDYYADASLDTAANAALNRAVLDRVTGRYGELEVINSGSVFELDEETLTAVRAVCHQRGIHTIHFEAHALYRSRIPALRQAFSAFSLKMKLGLETFDAALREGVLQKGIAETDPVRIAAHFDEANLLVGITGQTAASMRRDIEEGLRVFERLCVNVMCPNTAAVQPDAAVVDAFMREVYPLYCDCERVDILVQNTDFGVGELSCATSVC